MANEWSQELLNELNRAGQEFENAALSGDSRIPDSVRERVIDNVLFRTYQQQVAEARQRRAAAGDAVASAKSIIDGIAAQNGGAFANAARQVYEQSQASVQQLKADFEEQSTKAKRDMLSQFSNVTGENQRKAEAAQTALDQAVAESEKIRQDMNRAQHNARSQNSYRAVEDAYERGISYSDQNKAYSQALEKLNKDKAALTADLEGIRHGGRYIGDNPEEQAARQKADEDDALARLKALQKQIDDTQYMQRYAESRITSDVGAEAIIRQGEELARTAREQGVETADANRKVKNVADHLPNGAAGYTNFRNWVGLLSYLPEDGSWLASAAKAVGEAVRDLPEVYNPISFIAELGIRSGEDAQHQPQDNWTKEQVDLYNYFYGSKDYGPDVAKKYAQQLNYAINSGDVDNQTATQYKEGLNAGGSFGSKAARTIGGLVGAIPDMALAAGDFQNKALDIIATGDYAGHREATAHDKFSAFNRGRVEDLNRNTLSENIPIIGGKGWGDLYQLGQSSLQSLAMGNVLGEAATLGAFFVNAANSSFDEAMQRSGGNTKYASTVGLLSGAAEVIGEKLSLDHLLKGGKVGSLSFILKQAGIEGSEEVATSLMNQFFDRVASTLAGEQPAIQQQITDLVRSGMSYVDAEKKVWRDTVSDVAFDFVGGAISGGFSGAVQSGVRGTQNKLWEMRKDSVLGKQNAEGQREGGKKNASNDELSKMFDRALKRGDIRGAEQILQVIEQRGATAEEQEYGPVDPTANERMRKRLERQLNGESLNPETENAEAVEESATNRQLVEEARVQAEFPTVSPITMELVRRLDGKDFVTMAKSMTTQELAEVARYARYIGENAKADLLERIRLDPTYQYEEQPPAHTDEEAPPLNAIQNAAGQQVAPAGQITQPIQQNAAQTVKPGDSATAENKLFNVAQNPNGVSTRSTESGTITNEATEKEANRTTSKETAKPQENKSRFGMWFPSSQASQNTNASEAATENKQSATPWISSTTKGNEYLSNDYRTDIHFQGNGKVYHSVSEAMADPSVTRERTLEDVVRAKFQQNRELRQKLFATGNSRIDVGTELGAILERVREELRAPDSVFNDVSPYAGAEDMNFSEFSDLLGRQQEAKRESERKLLEKFGYKEDTDGELGTLSDSDGQWRRGLGNDGQRGPGLSGAAGQAEGVNQRGGVRVPGWVSGGGSSKHTSEVSGKEQTGDPVFKQEGSGIIHDGAYIYGYGSYRVEKPATGTPADFVLSVLAKAFGTEKNTVLVSGEIAVAGRPLERVIGGSNGVQIASSFKQYGSFREMTYGIRNYIHEVTHHVINDKLGGYGEEGNISNYDAYFNRKNVVYSIVKDGFSSKDIAGHLQQPVDALCDFYIKKIGYGKSYKEMGIEAEAQSRYRRLGAFGTKEALRACVSEEILNDILGGNNNIMKAVDAGLITEDSILVLREYFLQKLIDEGLYEDKMSDAIRKAHKAIEANDFLHANGVPFVKPRAQAEMELAANGIDANIDVNLAVRRAFAGDIRHMEDVELFAVLNYALDRASPSTKGKNISERLSDLYIEYGNSATSYISEMGDYLGRHVGKLSEGKTDNLMRTVDAVLRELDRRDVSIDDIQSDISDYENNFGIATRYGEKGAPWDTLARDDNKGNVSYAVSKRGRQLVELDQEYKPLQSEEAERKNRDDFNVQSREAAGVKTDDEIEEEFDAKRKPAIMRSLEKGNDIVESFGTYQPNGTRRRDVPVNPAKTTQKYQGRDIEDTGWIKPVETSRKDIEQARKAVKAKNEIAEYKEKKALLQAQVKYLGEVAKAMRTVRSHLFGSGDIEQRREDLNYLIDNTREQIEQLDADIGYLDDELGVDLERGESDNEEKLRHLLSAMDNATIQRQALSNRLDSLVDEVEDMYRGDSAAAYQNVRRQIDDVIEQINRLNVSLNGANGLIRQTEKAGWGSNKRTMFQAEMAENPAKESKREIPAPNVYGPYTTPALNRVFRQQVEAELEADQMRITDEDDSTDISEPTRGMGTGYVGMQRSRNKDGSLEFRTMYDDALPTRPATDKTRKPLNAPSTAYSSVAQAARSILNSKNGFLDFSKDRPKDIPSKVTNTMGQLREHVREMMEGDHPVNALMQLSNMVHEFENDDDLKVFSSDSIKKAVDELNDIYYNQDITNEEKARRMVENATKTLTLISKRIQLVDRGYNMLKTFTGPKKKRDNTTFWSKYKAMQLNPSTLFKAMDGFARDKNGSGYQIAKMIENGTALYTITQAQALKKLSDVSGLEGFKEFAEGNAKPFDIDGVNITEQQAVEFIMQVRNLQNTSVTGKDGPTTRLNTIDGFSIKDKDGNNTFIERSDDADGTNAEWFQTLAEAMENSLSPAAKKYLETATEILDDLGQQASDIRTNLIGTGFDNSINGTYYPINYDNKNGTSDSQQNKPTSLFSGPMYQSRTRNVGGYVSIKNASDTMDKYIHWASNAIGYGEVAELLYAMDNTGSRMQNLSSLANDTLGQGYSEYIAKYIKDINEIPDGQKNDKSAFAVLRRNMAAGALLGNLGVAAKQAASLWSAAGVLSPQALLSAETYFGGHSGAGNMILQSRMTGTSLDPTISEILHNDSFMGKLMKRSGVSEAMGKATAFVDYQTVKRLFAATVVDTKLSFPGLDQNSELFAQTVEAKFQDVVLQTQPIFVKNARAGYLRANDELTKAFAMFRTQPTQNLNSIVTAMGEYRALKGTEFGKAAGKKLRNTIIGQTASAVTFATLSAIVSFARHGLKKFLDDDDEISWAEVAKRIGLDSIESLAGISVVGGDIAKAIIDMATGGDTKEFYDMNAGVLTMLFDTVSSVTTFGTNVVKAIKDDKPLAVFNAGRQAADNLLQLGGGIPANTVYRLLNSITMYSADALRALSGGKLGNRANYDDALKMLDSYIRGDLTEEGAKTQAAKAFRKDQPENLLYNLGILSSLTSKDSKVDKGTDWLNTRIQGKTEAERKAYKGEELARLGRNLNAGERIANYLADSALSAAQKDEAISKFATTSGYNVLYESLRAAGMTPKAAVEELGKTDNKTGLGTDIRDDDSLAALYAGKDNPGETNDVPALDKKNTDEYVNFVSAMKVFRDTGNYSQLDKLVDQYSKLDDNTRAVIEAKDSTIGKYREYRSMGLSTKDYYNVKDAIKQAQIDLDLAANTGTAVKLVGLSKANLTKAQIQKLVNSEALGISKTGKSLISVLGKYGYTVGDIGMFMYNTDWTNDDSNGTLSQQEVVLALAKEKRLTDAQRSAIYEELKPLLRNEYKINHWYDKSYEYELNYLLQNGKTSGRAS